jgi:hypothetical protein
MPRSDGRAKLAREAQRWEKRQRKACKREAKKALERATSTSSGPAGAATERA